MGWPPPHPPYHPVYWNHRLSEKNPCKILNRKNLQAKYSIKKTYGIFLPISLGFPGKA